MCNLHTVKDHNVTNVIQIIHHDIVHLFFLLKTNEVLLMLGYCADGLPG